MSPWEWLEGPAGGRGAPLAPPARHLSKVGTIPLNPFLGRGLEGVETHPWEQWGPPQILTIPQWRGPAWGWFPSQALPALLGLCPRKTTTPSAKGPPCFDPQWDRHCLCCRLEPCGQHPPPQNHLLEISCSPSPSPTVALVPHKCPFYNYPTINLSLGSWPESCDLKGLSLSSTTPSALARSPGPG